MYTVRTKTSATHLLNAVVASSSYDRKYDPATKSFIGVTGEYAITWCGQILRTVKTIKVLDPDPALRLRVLSCSDCQSVWHLLSNATDITEDITVD